jgi:hypothetical protein
MSPEKRSQAVKSKEKGRTNVQSRGKDSRL